MSIEQVNSPDFDYDKMLATIEVAYIGKSDITISEFDSGAAPVVKVGSKFEVNGALFKVFSGDETPTGYAGISNSTIFYIMYDVSGGVFVFTSVAPVWNDALQGWYESGQTDRYFFSMFKDSGGTLYLSKSLLLTQNNVKLDGYIEYNSKRITSDNFITGNVSHDDIFQKIAPFIPDIGDFMLINGALDFNAVCYVERRLTNQLIFPLMQFAGVGGIANLGITEGVGTLLQTLLSW
jgi:hypothetical protein